MWWIKCPQLSLNCCQAAERGAAIVLEGHIRFTLLRCSKIHHPPIDPFQALRLHLRPTFSGPLPQYKGRRGAGARRRDGQAILSPKVTMWCRPASLRLLSSQVAPHSWETPWPSWLLSRPKSLHQGLTPMFMGLEAPGCYIWDPTGVQGPPRPCLGMNHFHLRLSAKVIS